MRSGRLAAWLLLVGVLVAWQAARATAGAAAPRIANGVLSQSYPAVGLLLLFSNGQPNGSCSGTMVGCDTFITAAHCACETTAESAAQCHSGGITPPADMFVFLQHGGMLAVRSVTINETFNFGIGGDLAILKLETPMRGIAPLPINRTRQPELGSSGTLVGFGTNGLDDSAGIKRSGKVVVGACTSDHPADRNVCWSFLDPQGPPGSNSDTCDGDSGGPLLIDFGAGNVVAGSTSGGSEAACMPPDQSFDTDIFFYRDFIASIGGSDLDSTRCGDLPHIGDAGVVEQDETGTLDSSQDRRYAVTVPAGTRLLRVGLNGGTGNSSIGNDFDLFLRREQEPTLEAFDCKSTSATTFEFCEVASPQPGTWNILVSDFSGQGDFQLTSTVFAGCVADCDSNGSTDSADLVHAVEIALGQQTTSTCGSADANADDAVTIEDLVLAVNATTSCRPAP